MKVKDKKYPLTAIEPLKKITFFYYFNLCLLIILLNCKIHSYLLKPIEIRSVEIETRTDSNKHGPYPWTHKFIECTLMSVSQLTLIWTGSEQSPELGM